MLVWFFTEQDEVTERIDDDTFAGGFGIRFSSSSQFQYWFPRCFDSTKKENFPANTVPTEIEKLWTVTVTRGSSSKIVIHCNGVEVLDFEPSDNTCEYGTWDRFWSRKAVKIYFHESKDTASDFYYGPPGIVSFERNRAAHNASSNT